MPSFQDHSEHSRHNLEFLNSFFLSRFNDWAVTVMFYSCVHMVEAIFGKVYSIHCQSHSERSGKLANLNQSSFPIKAYKALERGAHYSRYKNYKIYDWEVHQLFKDHFQTLVLWFNEQVETDDSLDIQTCRNIDKEWFERFKTKDPECNKYR